MNKKRLLGLLTATALLLSIFTACGPNDEDPVQDSANSATTTAQTGDGTSATDDSNVTTDVSGDGSTSASSGENGDKTTANTQLENTTKTTTTTTTTTITTTATTVQNASDYDNSYFSYRDGLLNTYLKLTQEKELTVAYMGGSVTYGIGTDDLSKSYRARTTTWLKKQFPDATITEVNAGVPSACSAFGAYWVDEVVLPAEPDLVFLEYAINDYYAKDMYSKEDVSRHYETIIRKIRKAYPQCDIVALYTTDNTVSQLSTAYFDQAAIQDEIAEKYGIPSINVGYQACQELRLTSGTSSSKWYTYFKDGVHPTAEGYARYALVITRCLQTALMTAPAEQSNVKMVNKTMPAATNSNLVMNSKYTQVLDVNVVSKTNWSSSQTGKGVGGFVYHNGYLYTGTADNSLTFKVTGTQIAIFCTAGRSITYSIDGGAEKTVSKNNHPILLGSGLSSGTHTVTIKCNDVAAKGTFQIAGVLTA